MSKKSNLVPTISVIVIIASVLISGYILLGPKSQGSAQSNDESGLVSMVDGKQLVQMTVKSVSYEPNYFKVKVGVPVRWEITSSGQPGCDAGELVARGLMDPVYLNPNAGQVTTAEFTPQTPGEYTFSCPMGMVRGKIVVVN